MHLFLTAVLLLTNLFLSGMLVQVILTPKDNVVLIDKECPQVQECKDTKIIIEACDPEIVLDACINEKIEYGDQLTEIDRILNPEKFIEQQ